MDSPPFPLLLCQEDQEPIVDLQRLLNQLYQRSGYDLKLDYQGQPAPPFARR